VKFTDTSTGSPSTWNWSFGDGTWFNTTVATLKSPTHIYTGAGSFTVRLIAGNAAGMNTTAPTRIITVT
jgi:PKD repeat protein